MVKLFYSPTSCGAASFIAAFKAGLNLQAEQVDIQNTHRTASGADFYTINPNGNVPCLLLDDGTILNENASVLQWIADQNADSLLAPAAGTNERYMLMNELSFIGTEIHQGVGRLFKQGSSEVNAANMEIARMRLAKLEKKLTALHRQGQTFLVGNNFTVADAYLCVVLSWFPNLGLNYEQWPAINHYFKSVSGVDVVRAAQCRMASCPETIIGDADRGTGMKDVDMADKDKDGQKDSSWFGSGSSDSSRKDSQKDSSSGSWFGSGSSDSSHKDAQKDSSSGWFGSSSSDSNRDSRDLNRDGRRDDRQ